MKTRYPECGKMAAVKDQSQAIGEFLDWFINEKKVELGIRNHNGFLIQFHPSYERLLAEYFDIDLDKAEEEKRQMLDKLRKKNANTTKNR